MDAVRKRLTYANVVASLALFLALGGSAVAVNEAVKPQAPQLWPEAPGNIAFDWTAPADPDGGKQAALERAFAQAGGLLLAGLDPTGMGGVIAGFGDQREVELLVEAGFTPVEAIHIATAIITEATLSFLGVGVPPTQPSLGTLIRVGNEFLYSGEWWITIFPGAALIVLVLSVNLLGDWLRDALNPKLR